QSGGSWHGPQGLGMGPLGSKPSVAAHNVTGEQDVFWQGTDNQLWEGFYKGARWVGPQSLGMSPLGSPPSVAVLPSNEEDVVWSGTDANIWLATWMGGPWSGPTPVGMGPLGSPPGAAARGTETDVFWQGTDRNLWEACPRGARRYPLDHGGPALRLVDVAVTGCGETCGQSERHAQRTEHRAGQAARL